MKTFVYCSKEWMFALEKLASAKATLSMLARFGLVYVMSY
jgi:hypothetical protein